jgi:hypothetical protein
MVNIFVDNFSAIFLLIFFPMLSRIRLLEAIMHQPTFYIAGIGELLYNSKFPFTISATVLIRMNVDIMSLIHRNKNNIPLHNGVSFRYEIGKQYLLH